MQDCPETQLSMETEDARLEKNDLQGDEQVSFATNRCLLQLNYKLIL